MFSTAQVQLFRLSIESPHKPTVIKPNNEELSQLLGKEVSEDLDELKEVLQEPLFAAIGGLSFHLGTNGAFAKHGDTFYKVDIPRIQVVNPVGSGILLLQVFHQVFFIRNLIKNSHQGNVLVCSMLKKR